jgi:PAS domain S-box-containing protein
MREPKILNKIFRNSLGYAVAVGAVALATWLKLLAQPNIIPTDVPILYLVAIVPIAIFFGLGPSLLVCVLSFLAYDYYFIPPIHQITYSADAGPILAIFLIVGVLFSYLTSNLRRQNQVANKEIAARKQSEEELIRYRDHLEELVKERTFELEKTNSELKTEIIEHKKDEEALRQSEERWATTLASIGDGVIATDMLGRVTFMNTVAQDLTGWKTGEANQKPIAEVFNIVNETTRQKAENPVDKVLQLGIICSLANHTILMQKDGAEISIDDSGAPIKDAQDVTTGVVLVFRDITERRKAEIMLRRVEERNRLLADILEHASQPFGIGLPDGSLGIVNKAFCDLTGYTAEELKTMDWAKVLTPPEYLSMEEEKLAELVRTGQPVRYQKEYIRKDKSRVPIELLVHLMRNAEGQAEYYYSFLTDISERKRAEEEKQTTLNRFYTILSKMPLGILLVSQDGLTEFANPTFCEMFHLKQSPEEVRNLAANEVINKIQNVYENSEMAVARITEIVNRGEQVKDEEVPLRDGRVVLRDFVPIWLGENRYGRLWIHRDITERKKMEDALKDSEAKANALIKYAPTAIYELDYRIPRIISVNEAVSSMSGYTREELLSMNPTDLMDEDSKNRFAERMKSTLAGRKIDETVDFRIKKKNGSFMYVTLNVSLSPEKPFTALVIAHDITERKMAEIEISRLSLQRQLALDAAHMGWWQFDPATQMASYDEGYQRIFGVSGSQRPNEEILKRLHPDDLPRVWASVEAALYPADPRPYSAQYRIFLNDGAVRGLKRTVSPPSRVRAPPGGRRALSAPWQISPNVFRLMKSSKIVRNNCWTLSMAPPTVFLLKTCRDGLSP